MKTSSCYWRCPVRSSLVQLEKIAVDLHHCLLHRTSETLIHQFNKQLLSTAPFELMAVQCLSMQGKHCWGWLSLCAQLRPTPCSPMHCSPSGSSVHGISQARILERVAVSYSRGSFPPSNWTSVSYVSCIGRRVLYHCATSGWELMIMCVGKEGRIEESSGRNPEALKGLVQILNDKQAF